MNFIYEYSLKNYILYTTQLSIMYTFGLFGDIHGVHFRECDHGTIYLHMTTEKIVIINSATASLYNNLRGQGRLPPQHILQIDWCFTR